MKHKGILLKRQLRRPDGKSSRDVTAYLVFYRTGGVGEGLDREGGLLQNLTAKKGEGWGGAYKSLFNVFKQCCSIHASQ